MGPYGSCVSVCLLTTLGSMMNRVSHRNPCPVCKHEDWCLYSPEGDAAICTRISEGSTKKCGDAGYLHILKPGDFKPKPVVKKRPATINWHTLNRCYTESVKEQFKDGLGTVHKTIHDLSTVFGVSRESLASLENGWDGEAYTFPVRNADDEIVGITRRWPDGTKGMVKGSQVGIYIPRISWAICNK